MGFYQIVSSLKTAVDMRKKAVSNISQKHDGTIIQPNARIYQELGVRACLLHAYCSNSFSFDTARCCLLFYDWYVQKISKDKEK